MNFIEHLTNPKIGLYCYDIAPFDANTFKEQIVNTILLFMLFLNFITSQILS